MFCSRRKSELRGVWSCVPAPGPARGDGGQRALSWQLSQALCSPLTLQPQPRSPEQQESQHRFSCPAGRGQSHLLALAEDPGGGLAATGQAPRELCWGKSEPSSLLPLLPLLPSGVCSVDLECNVETGGPFHLLPFP